MVSIVPSLDLTVNSGKIMMEFCSNAQVLFEGPVREKHHRC